ncbi:MAG: hypothetical protein Q9N26_04040 [Aquificota bacterium]|nr:hypothetical protein [Aquificota bacterium]
MKKDLTHLLKREEPVEGFESPEEAKEYVARYLLNYINLELEGLPREEWDRTLETWVRICGFARGLLKKGEEERREIYRRFNFDMMMEGIAEDVRKTFIGFLRLGLVGEDTSPQEFLLRAVELIKDREDLIRKWDLKPEIVRFMWEFLSGSRG